MAKYTVAFHRNPRFLALLFICGLATVYWLTGSPSTPYFHAFTSGKSLKWFLIEEDQHYDKVIRDREAMVHKWGPTPALVESFPPKDDFYTLWDFFIPGFNCPHRVERVGTMGDGGKWVCGMERLERQKECVIYSFGINGESSFEAELLERAPGCQLWGYDFSVKSFGPEIEKTALAERAHFYPYGLAGADAHSAGQDPPMYTLPTLMQLNGHTFIDVLKVDIEGYEFESLDAFVEHFALGVLPVGQIQIEIHARDGVHDQFTTFKGWWERLEAAGLRPFMAEPNLVYVNLVRGVRPDLVEYSFMNIRGNHALVSDSFDQPRWRRD